MFDVEVTGGEALTQAIANLAPNRVRTAVKQASKRAATAARVAGTKRIRSIYNIKSGDLKSRAQIKPVADGTVLHVRGPFEPARKYKAKEKPKGVFVAIKKSGGALVPRSFALGGDFVAREGKERYPLRGLYGPAVPQLFGNPEVMSEMQERAGEVFENRLRHEVERLIGG